MEQPKARLTLQQSQQAINEAIWIDASPHEWPTIDKMWLLCSALIDSVQMVDYLRIRLAAVEAERDAARAEAEARVKQNETQIRIHFQNTREWKEALKKAQAAEARAVEALKEIAVFAQGLRERSDVSTFVVIGHMIEGYLNKHAAQAAALRAGEEQ